MSELAELKTGLNPMLLGGDPRGANETLPIGRYSHLPPLHSFLSGLFCLLAAVGLPPVSSDLHAQGARHPPEPYHVSGACPFEGCVYREWIARETLNVYASPTDTASIDFRVSPGTKFHADSGFVRLRQVGMVLILDELYQYGYEIGQGHAFAPGDTLYVLDYLGEGVYNVWYRGSVLEATDYWFRPEQICEESDKEIRAIEIRQPVLEWWVHITLEDGRSGWLFMHESSVEGADILANVLEKDHYTASAQYESTVRHEALTSKG